MKKGVIITVVIAAVLIILLVLRCEKKKSAANLKAQAGDHEGSSPAKQQNSMPPGIVFEPAGIKNRYCIFLLSVTDKGEKKWLKKYTAVEPSWAEAVFVLKDGGILLLAREYDRQQDFSRPFIMLCAPDGNKISETYLDSTPLEYKLVDNAAVKFDPVKEDDIRDIGYTYEVDRQDGTTLQRYSGMKYYEWGALNLIDRRGAITELSNPEAPGYDYYEMNLLRKKEDGTKLWASSFGGTGFERGYSFDAGQNGDIILAGVTDSYGAGGTDMYLVRVDAKGNSVWSGYYGTQNDESAHAVTSGEKMTAVTGSSCGGKNGCDIILLLIDKDGNTRTIRTFDAGADESAYCISPFEDGYIIAGISGDF